LPGIYGLLRFARNDGRDSHPDPSAVFLRP
jgi:hypothetical protein